MLEGLNPELEDNRVNWDGKTVVRPDLQMALEGFMPESRLDANTSSLPENQEYL